MRAVERIFSVFDAFDADHTKLTLQEISERIGLSKATTFRLVNSLDKKGYLVRLEDQRYCLSMKILRLAGVVASGLNVRDIAHPIIVELAQESGETVSLNTAVGTDRVCIDVVESTSRMMHIVTLGEHAPLLYGATGKVLLAHLEENEQQAVVKTLPPDSHITQAELKAQLASIRTSGYVITASERVLGSLAISVAIYDLDDRGRYALTLTGPEGRMKDHEKYLQLMLDAQRDVSAKMGASRFTIL